MYEQYGAKSSTQMNENEIEDLIHHISGKVQNNNNRTDLLRKRVIAVIFNYYNLKKIEVSIDYVKATATRASGCKSFNAIPDAVLNNLYNAFLDKNRNRISVTNIDNRVDEYLTSSN